MMEKSQPVLRLLGYLLGRYAPAIVFVLFSLWVLNSIYNPVEAYFLGVLAGGGAGFLLGDIYVTASAGRTRGGKFIEDWYE